MFVQESDYENSGFLLDDISLDLAVLAALWPGLTDRQQCAALSHFYQKCEVLQCDVLQCSLWQH